MTLRALLRSTVLPVGLLATLISACADEGLQDAGVAPDASASADAGETGGGADAGASGCTTLTLGDVVLDEQQDVQTIYSARLQTSLGSAGPDYLVFNFVNVNERFGIMGIGDFSLAEAPNDNRATCPECLSVFVDQVTANSRPAQVFFQSAGRIQLSVNPRDQVLRGRVTGLELIEVTIDDGTLVSTPVPGGACLRIEDFDLDYKFVPPEWTCDEALYRSGDYTCNCDCGAPDPDCFCDPFMDPNCPQTIEDDCPMGSVCTPNGCQAGCDPFSVPAVGCEAGQLCAFSATGPSCIDSTGRVNAAQLGQVCMGVGGLVQYCAVTQTVPAGICDDFDQTCRPICQGTMGCGMDEQCFTIAGGGPEQGGYGYCRPAGDVPPPEWTCDPDDYGEGIACHCNCGASDPDCAEGELMVVGCNPGEGCFAGVCE